EGGERACATRDDRRPPPTPLPPAPPPPHALHPTRPVVRPMRPRPARTLRVKDNHNGASTGAEPLQKRRFAKRRALVLLRHTKALRADDGKLPATLEHEGRRRGKTRQQGGGSIEHRPSADIAGKGAIDHRAPGRGAADDRDQPAGVAELAR